MKPQHHWGALQDLDQPSVVVERRPQRQERGAQSGVKPQRSVDRVDQLVECGQAGAAIGFAQHQVEPDEAGALTLGGCSQQVGQQRPAPGPASVFGQRTFGHLTRARARLSHDQPLLH